MELKSYSTSSGAVQNSRHPALDAGSPTPNIGRRCRIGVRHDGIKDECSSFTTFLGQPWTLINKLIIETIIK